MIKIFFGTQSHTKDAPSYTKQFLGGSLPTLPLRQTSSLKNFAFFVVKKYGTQD
jgi:hypothetical protein